MTLILLRHLSRLINTTSASEAVITIPPAPHKARQQGPGGTERSCKKQPAMLKVTGGGGEERIPLRSAEYLAAFLITVIFHTSQESELMKSDTLLPAVPDEA